MASSSRSAKSWVAVGSLARKPAGRSKAAIAAVDSSTVLAFLSRFPARLSVVCSSRSACSIWAAGSTVVVPRSWAVRATPTSRSSRCWNRPTAPSAALKASGLKLLSRATLPITPAIWVASKPASENFSNSIFWASLQAAGSSLIAAPLLLATASLAVANA